MSKTPTIPERIAIIKSATSITEDAEFGRQGGMSKSVVNQLLGGQIKSISPRYAYELEKNTGFNARWIMLGEGPERLSPNTSKGPFVADTKHLAEDLADYSTFAAYDSAPAKIKALVDRILINANQLNSSKAALKTLDGALDLALDGTISIAARILTAGGLMETPKKENKNHEVAQSDSDQGHK